VAAEGTQALEAGRWHVERTPQFRVTISGANPGEEHLNLSVFLVGPPDLEGLDSMTVRIRDDYPGRAEGNLLAGGPSPDQVAAQIWGPYRFLPGSGPDNQLSDATGRVTATRGMPVGESLPFVLTPTSPPSWSPSRDWWRRKLRGTVIRLQLECGRGVESWSLPCEVDVDSLPRSGPNAALRSGSVTVEVPERGA
jgi:hypothetical protein